MRYFSTICLLLLILEFTGKMNKNYCMIENFKQYSFESFSDENNPQLFNNC